MTNTLTLMIEREDLVEQVRSWFELYYNIHWIKISVTSAFEISYRDLILISCTIYGSNECIFKIFLKGYPLKILALF